MRLQLKNATVVYTDMFAIKYDFVANHTKYGMTLPSLKVQNIWIIVFTFMNNFMVVSYIASEFAHILVCSGIKWPLMVCCGNGGPPYNFKPGKFGCDDLCEPGSKVLSWDGVHFTDFGSGLAAKLAMSGEYSKPKVKLASLVNAGSNKSSDSWCQETNKYHLDESWIHGWMMMNRFTLWWWVMWIDGYVPTELVLTLISSFVDKKRQSNNGEAPSATK